MCLCLVTPSDGYLLVRLRVAKYAKVYVHTLRRHSDKEDAEFKGEVRSSSTLAPCSSCALCLHPRRVLP